jgi:hypothetical protein
MYGRGFYGNYNIESVMSGYSKKTYGDYVVKYIIKPKNIIFFDKEQQVRFFGKTMDLIEQLNYWKISIPKEFYNKISLLNDKITSHMSDLTSSDITSKFAVDFIEITNNVPLLGIYGMLYTGKKDHNSIVIYKPELISFVGYYSVKDDYKSFTPITHKIYSSKKLASNIVDNISDSTPSLTKLEKKVLYERLDNNVFNFFTLSDDEINHIFDTTLGKNYFGLTNYPKIIYKSDYEISKEIQKLNKRNIIFGKKFGFDNFRSTFDMKYQMMEMNNTEFEQEVFLLPVLNTSVIDEILNIGKYSFAVKFIGFSNEDNIYLLNYFVEQKKYATETLKSLAIKLANKNDELRQAMKDIISITSFKTLCEKNGLTLDYIKKFKPLFRWEILNNRDLKEIQSNKSLTESKIKFKDIDFQIVDKIVTTISKGLITKVEYSDYAGQKLSNSMQSDISYKLSGGKIDNLIINNTRNMTEFYKDIINDFNYFLPICPTLTIKHELPTTHDETYLNGFFNTNDCFLTVDDKMNFTAYIGTKQYFGINSYGDNYFSKYDIPLYTVDFKEINRNLDDELRNITKGTEYEGYYLYVRLEFEDINNPIVGTENFQTRASVGLRDDGAIEMKIILDNVISLYETFSDKTLLKNFIMMIDHEWTHFIDLQQIVKNKKLSNISDVYDSEKQLVPLMGNQKEHETTYITGDSEIQAYATTIVSMVLTYCQSNFQPEDIISQLNLMMRTPTVSLIKISEWYKQTFKTAEYLIIERYIELKNDKKVKIAIEKYGSLDKINRDILYKDISGEKIWKRLVKLVVDGIQDVITNYNNYTDRKSFETTDINVFIEQYKVKSKIKEAVAHFCFNELYGLTEIHNLTFSDKQDDKSWGMIFGGIDGFERIRVIFGYEFSSKDLDSDIIKNKKTVRINITSKMVWRMERDNIKSVSDFLSEYSGKLDDISDKIFSLND